MRIVEIRHHFIALARHTPFALLRLLVPWDKHIVRLDGGSFSAEVFRDLGKEFVLLGLINHRHAVHNQYVVESFFVLDFVPADTVKENPSVIAAHRSK